MAHQRVGWITATVLLFSAVGAGHGAPSDDFFLEEYQDEDGALWELVNGTVEYNTTINRAGDPLTWLVLGDDSDVGGVNVSRVRSAPSQINTSLSSFELHAIIERDHTYVAPNDAAPAPGWFGLTFGEADPSQGYYIAGFADDLFGIGTPNATTGNFDILHLQNDWGTVPSWIEDVNDRHRYMLIVDGTQLTVKIDGWTLGSFALPGVPTGTIGLAAADDTQIYVEQLLYRPLDTTAPTVDLFRPDDATAYIADEPVGIPASGLTVAAGELTVVADIADDLIGTRVAYLDIDGRLVPKSHRLDPGIKTTWVIDTTKLVTGYHDITVRAFDYSGNVGSATVRILVVSPVVQPGAAAAAGVETAGHLLPL